MKKLAFAFVGGVLVSLVMMSCGSKDESKKQGVKAEASNRDSIKVGMTYDEVEKLLSKPSQILRGSNQLEMNLPSSGDGATLRDIEARLKELKFMRAVAETARALNVWPYPHEVKTIGQLIYVNWVYSEPSFDTNYVWIENKEIRNETFQVVDAYLLNGRVVEKKWYDHFKEGEPVYRNSEDIYLSKREWEEQKNSRPGTVWPVEPAEKTIRYSAKQRQLTIPLEPTKKFYVVTKMFCVLFDASSGRVVQSGFQPFFVNEMK